MKINVTSYEKIANALTAAHGRATSHVATTPDVTLAVRSLERRLEELGLPKNARAGATAVYQSGGSVPAAYKYTRTVTRVKLARFASGWFVTNVTTADVWPSSSGGEFLTLTDEQDSIVYAKIRSTYSVDVTTISAS